MTGQMTKYKESLRHMPEPIMLSQIQKKVDLRGLMNYAKEKGIKVTQLTKKRIDFCFDFLLNHPILTSNFSFRNHHLHK